MIDPTWQAGDCSLYLGDCLDILPQLGAGSVDAVVTDPPYGIAYISGMRKPETSFGLMNSDDITNAAWLIFVPRIIKIGGAIYCFSRWDVLGIWKHLFEFFGLSVKNCIVWDKEQGGMGDLSGSYSPSHEMILLATRGKHLLNGNRPKDVIRIQRMSGQRVHPTEKPIELMRELILNSTDAGTTILDPFMGSGTTGVACVQTGRKFIGIEIEPKYFDIAVKRIQQAQLQIRMEI